MLTLGEIRTAAKELAGTVVRTPTKRWHSQTLAEAGFGHVQLKYELWQHSGSFKFRAARLILQRMTAGQRARGVVAASGGNHALAVAMAAHQLGADATVVMPRTAPAMRIQGCRDAGASVELVADIHGAFERAEALSRQEGALWIHPFEGPLTALGSATCGLEWVEDAGPMDVVVIPIGGGGLCAGAASAVRSMLPACQVIGVEPAGADTMSRSLRARMPVGIPRVRTIADSLAAPTALPYSFQLCARTLTRTVRVTDDEIRRGMRVIRRELGLAVEPGCAAAAAACLGPLAHILPGRRLGLLLCGSNIEPHRFEALARA